MVCSNLKLSLCFIPSEADYTQQFFDLSRYRRNSTFSGCTEKTECLWVMRQSHFFDKTITAVILYRPYILTQPIGSKYLAWDFNKHGWTKKGII